MNFDLSQHAAITVLKWPFNRRLLCHMAEVHSRRFSSHSHSAKHNVKHSRSHLWAEHTRYNPPPLLLCSSHHVVDNVDVIGDPSHLITLFHVGPLWISRGQNRGIRVSLTNSSTSGFQLHILLASQRDDSQAPAPSGWTWGQTSSRWTREQSCLGWSPQNIDPESTKRLMTM